MRHFRVLIVSFAHWEGLSRLPALLHEVGCEISVLGVQGNFPASSRYVKQLYISPNDVDAVVADLNVHLQNQAEKYDWIVIGDDPLLYALEKRRKEPWVQQHFPTVAGDAGIDFITSKAVFIEACRAKNMSVPDYDLCEDQTQLQAAGRRLGFPLVIKEAQGFAGLAVRVVDSHDALKSIQVNQQVIAQKFIDGRLVSAAAIYQAGKPIAWFSYYRSRTWGSFGPSAAIELKIFPELQGILQQLGELSGFHGLCGIDFIEKHDTGELVLLEQNFRPTLTMNLGKRAGVDFVAAVRNLLNSEPVNNNVAFRQKDRPKKIIPLFPQDVFRAIDAHDFGNLLKWLFYPVWWLEMRWQEPVILLMNLRHILQKLRGRKKVNQRKYV